MPLSMLVSQKPKRSMLRNTTVESQYNIHFGTMEYSEYSYWLWDYIIIFMALSIARY